MYDFIIIGSGTSGGTIAYYLTQAGARCLLLEAGRDYPARAYPDNELTYQTQMCWNGGMDVNVNADLSFIRGKCVGGGSVINQCLLDRFTGEVFSEWKELSGIEFFDVPAMAAHYQEVESRLSLQEVSAAHRNRNAILYTHGFDKLGFKWAPLRRGQTDCAIEKGNDCIVCLGGCRRKSKQSIPVVFLPPALAKGLELRPDFEVESIRVDAGTVKVRGGNEEVCAPKCILAGGALGTTQLLLKSGFKAKLPALGKGFFSHPQVMNVATFDEPVDSHKGAFQSVKSDDPEFRKQGFKLENVFGPPIGMAILYPYFGKKHQRFMSKYRYLACMEVAVRDATPGEIGIDRNGRLKIYKSLRNEDLKRLKAGLKTVRELFETVGAREIFHARFWFCLHLMGGCAIGTDPARSVVDEKFRVHGYPQLYIADASVFPSAPGINPALTIMALSHRAGETILQSGKG